MTESRNTKLRPLYITFVISALVLLAMAFMMSGRSYKTMELNAPGGGSTLIHLFDRDAKDAPENKPHTVVLSVEGEHPTELKLQYRQKGQKWEEAPFVQMHRAGDSPIYAVQLPSMHKPGRWYYQFVASYQGQSAPQVFKLSDSKDFYVTFEGACPFILVVLHVFLMIVAVVFFFHVLHYALEIILNGTTAQKCWWAAALAVGTFIISAFAIGPPISGYTFGEPFGPIPFGSDITDTKSLYMTLFWLIPILMRLDVPTGREGWKRLSDRGFGFFCLCALVLSLIVFFIPHSLFVQG